MSALQLTLPARLLVIVVLLLSTIAEAAPQRILLLSQPAWSTQEAALVESLRIYTRDLSCSIVVSAAPRTSLGVLAPQQIVAQGVGAKASVVAWFADAAGLQLFSLRVATGDIQATLLDPSSDPSSAAPSLALKLRALLTSEPTRSQELATEVADSQPGSERTIEQAVQPQQQVPAAPQTSSTATAPSSDSHQEAARTVSTATESKAQSAAATLPAKAEVTSVKSPAPVVLTSAATASGQSMHRARSAQLELGLGYALNLPTESAWLRHGLELRAGLVWLTRIPLALELDGILYSQVVADIPPYQLSITDIPLTLAISARLIRPRFMLSAGIRTSLHILLEEALLGDSLVDKSRRVSAGLGVIGQARLQLLRFLSLNLAIHGEVTVPRQRFSAGDQQLADLGLVRFGASVGAVLLVR